jgi:hypothetical protein
VPSQTQGVPPSEPKNLDYLQKFLLRVVAHLDIPNPSFFLASLNLEDEIPFKGARLEHPKFLCQILD